MNEYNILTAKVTIPPDFGFVGKTLREMPFRKTSGVNILKILRGTHSFLIPSGDCLIMPGDTLVAVGTKEQLDKFIANPNASFSFQEGDLVWIAGDKANVEWYK